MAWPSRYNHRASTSQSPVIRGQMGWRAWDAYDQEAKERWRALPWHERYNWRAIAVVALLVAVVLLVFFAIRAAKASPIDSNEIRVIDGDTIRIHHAKPDVRLVGFNAPETKRAKCEVERELGAKATRRVRDLIRTTKLDLEFVACSCPKGTEGTRYCNYGRRCGTLKADGKDVGAILIAEGLAVPFICGKTRCPKTPHPWCH